MIYYSTGDNYKASFVLNSVSAERLFELSPGTCTDEDFKEVEISRLEGYEYACVDIFKTLGKVNTIGNPSKRFFALSITACPVWRDFKHNLYVGNGNYSFELDLCNSTSYSELGKTVNVGFAAKFWQFDKNKPSLQKQIIKYDESNDSGDMIFSEITVKENKLYDDVGRITSDIRYSLFASSDRSSNEIKKGWNRGTFGRLYVAIYEQNSYYTQKQRTTQKISNLAVQLTGIFQLLTVGYQILLSLITDYLFIKHLFKYFTRSAQDLLKASSRISTKQTNSRNQIYPESFQEKEKEKEQEEYEEDQLERQKEQEREKEQDLKIGFLDFLKWKLFNCSNKFSLCKEIIYYASYERLYQNTLSNKIILKLLKNLKNYIEKEIQKADIIQDEASRFLDSQSKNKMISSAFSEQSGEDGQAYMP